MIVRAEPDLNCHELEVVIRCKKIDSSVERLLALLQAVERKMKCYNEDGERFVNLSDVFYMESVDKKTFVYLEKRVYRTDLRLYQLADDLAQSGFVQISKACILNINVLEQVKPLVNSRMVATLKNGEQLHITRNYLNGLKQALQKGMEA